MNGHSELVSESLIEHIESFVKIEPLKQVQGNNAPFVWLEILNSKKIMCLQSSHKFSKLSE